MRHRLCLFSLYLDYASLSPPARDHHSPLLGDGIESFYFKLSYKIILVSINSVDELEDTLKKIYSGALKAEDFTPGGLMNLLKILNKAKKENGAFQVQLKLGD